EAHAEIRSWRHRLRHGPLPAELCSLPPSFASFPRRAIIHSYPTSGSRSGCRSTKCPRLHAPKTLRSALPTERSPTEELLPHARVPTGEWQHQFWLGGVSAERTRAREKPAFLGAASSKIYGGTTSDRGS